MLVRNLPGDDRSCGWNEILPPLKPARRLNGGRRADWVVLGAGFTGLAAARRLAELEPDASVILLEAQRVGFGASGRNSGLLVDVGHYHEKLGVEGNRRLLRLSRAGISELREIVGRKEIDCAWSECGCLHGAVGRVGMRCLDRFRRGLDGMEESYKWLDAEALAAVMGTSYYRAAVHLPGSVLVQPAALARGLAAALPPGVELFEESPVGAVRQDGRIRLDCPEGSVEADRLLLAGNAFTPSLGFLRRRLFPMLTFASLTRPLEEEAVNVGGDSQWGLVSEEKMGTSLRRGPQNRILIRNTILYTGGLHVGNKRLQKVRQLHSRSLRARFPALRNVELEYTWAGVMGVSLNNAQFFGRVAPEVFASAGYNGVGIALGTVSGKLLADLAAGSDSELLHQIQMLPKPAWSPPNPLLWLGVRATLAYLQARAGKE